MSVKNLVLISCATLALAAGSRVDAAVLFGDQFNYPNGELTINDGTGDNVSGGAWVPHSGQTFDDNIDVISGQADVRNSGSEDAKRVVPGGQFMDAGDKWYFAALLTVNDLRSDPATQGINNDYFLHFMDNGFGFRTRVFLDNPSTGVGGAGYRFGLSATSGPQTQVWGSDLSFGTQYTVVGSYDFDSGASELWVNPVDESSTKLVESTTVGPGTFVDALSLRQDFITGGVPNNQILIDAVGVGDSLADALAGLTIPEPSSMALALAGLIAGVAARRHRG
jgi:hypothetical protein